MHIFSVNTIAAFQNFTIFQSTIKQKFLPKEYFKVLLNETNLRRTYLKHITYNLINCLASVSINNLALTISNK